MNTLTKQKLAAVASPVPVTRSQFVGEMGVAL